MSKLVGTRLSDTTVPADSRNTFPTHTAMYGKGGYRSVATLEDRNKIPVERLELGALVKVVNDNTTYEVIDLSRITSISQTDSEGNTYSYNVLTDEGWRVSKDKSVNDEITKIDSKISGLSEDLGWDEF